MGGGVSRIFDPLRTLKDAQDMAEEWKKTQSELADKRVARMSKYLGDFSDKFKDLLQNMVNQTATLIEKMTAAQEKDFKFACGLLGKFADNIVTCTDNMNKAMETVGTAAASGVPATVLNNMIASSQVVNTKAISALDGLARQIIPILEKLSPDTKALTTLLQSVNDTLGNALTTGLQAAKSDSVVFLTSQPPASVEPSHVAEVQLIGVLLVVAASAATVAAIKAILDKGTSHTHYKYHIKIGIVPPTLEVTFESTDPTPNAVVQEAQAAIGKNGAVSLSHSSTDMRGYHYVHALYMLDL